MSRLAVGALKASISSRVCARLDVCEGAFDAIVCTTDDGVVVIDQQGLICFTNAAADAMLGRSTGELLGERFAIPAVPGKTADIDLMRKAAASDCRDARRLDHVAGQPRLSPTLRDVTERQASRG